MFAYGFSGVAVVKGRRPSSSFRFCACIVSSRFSFSSFSCVRNEVSSDRKFLIRSWAFSCFAGFSSCFASALYSSSVLEKAVSEAESEPIAAGVGVVPSPDEMRVVRSRFMEVDCLSAELNCVF